MDWKYNASEWYKTTQTRKEFIPKTDIKRSLQTELGGWGKLSRGKGKGKGTRATGKLEAGQT